MEDERMSVRVAEGARSLSPWAPFREPLFRSIWIAAVISYIGTCMQNLGSAWLMTSLTRSPLMIALVQAASSLSVFLIPLLAVAMSDLVVCRVLLLVTLNWLATAAPVLVVITILFVVTPWTLFLPTFLLGLGAVMNVPAWQAITPEIVSPPQHASGVALNSAGFNVARSVGPALGGAVIAAAGSGVAFLINAASFFAVIFVVYQRKR